MHFKNGLASDLISMYKLVYCSWVIVVATVTTKGLTMSTRLGEDWNRVSILHSNRLRDFRIRSRTKDEQTQNYLKTNFSVIFYLLSHHKKLSFTLENNEIYSVFNSCEKFLNYANSRYSNSWQLFRKFSLIRTADDTLRWNVNRNVWTVFCIIEIAEVVSSLAELVNSPWLYLSNPQ